MSEVDHIHHCSRASWQQIQNILVCNCIDHRSQGKYCQCQSMSWAYPSPCECSLWYACKGNTETALENTFYGSNTITKKTFLLLNQYSLKLNRHPMFISKGTLVFWGGKLVCYMPENKFLLPTSCLFFWANEFCFQFRRENIKNSS